MIQKKQLIINFMDIELITHPPLQLSMSKEIDNNWLKLKNPKIICLVSDIENMSLKKMTHLANVTVDDLSNPINSRVDKKNKNHNKSIDPLESKKNKVKKKPRAKIHINDDDDNIETSSLSFSKSHSNLALSLMRPVNPTKKNTLVKRSIANVNSQKKTLEKC